MIIRSQDKKTTSDDMNLHIQEREIGKYTFFNIRNSKDVCLGSYKTIEKAIKVLDMIQQEYGRHFYGQGGQMATADIYIQPFAFIPPKVFQMPSDEEVEV